MTSANPSPIKLRAFKLERGFEFGAHVIFAVATESKRGR